ncbi:MAG: hypothetical protein JWN93_1326 [Hyphomicrobiales bacterium]|jgi:hypothetical protein|nr:hypothetical protein [Hyphomicrobiales bacterium]
MNTPDNQETPPGGLRRMTAEEARSRRARNIAIGIAVGLFVLLFYVVTVAKLGVGVLDRPL